MADNVTLNHYEHQILPGSPQMTEVVNSTHSARHRRQLGSCTNNMPAHSAFIVTDYLVKGRMPMTSLSLYSLDLASPTFFCLCILKHLLKAGMFR